MPWSLEIYLCRRLRISAVHTEDSACEVDAASVRVPVRLWRMMAGHTTRAHATAIVPSDGRAVHALRNLSTPVPQRGDQPSWLMVATTDLSLLRNSGSRSIWSLT